MLLAQSRAVADEPCERDPCVVPTESLAPVVQSFVSRHEATYPLVSAYDVLSKRTNGEISSATIRKVAARTYRLTELRTADAIVAAVGRTDIWHSGELEIIGNPRVPKSLRGSCCGSVRGMNGAAGPI